MTDEAAATAAIRIRPVAADDAVDLARLCTQLGFPATETQVARRLKRLDADDSVAVLVAEGSHDANTPSPRVIGWIEVGLRHELVNDGDAEILGLVVDEACRSRGVGRRLVQAAERWAAAQGQSQLRVRSNVGRSRAHEFYRWLGFDETKRQAVFRKMLRPNDGLPPDSQATRARAEQ